MPYKTTAEEG